MKDYSEYISFDDILIDGATCQRAVALIQRKDKITLIVYYLI